MRFTEAELAELRRHFRQRVATTPAIRRRRSKPKPPPITAPVREPADHDAILRTRDVADLFGVQPRVVARWADAGKLPSFRTLGGHRRFRWGELRAFVV
jgi:excisionase family DNA binding protein